MNSSNQIFLAMAAKHGYFVPPWFMMSTADSEADPGGGGRGGHTPPLSRDEFFSGHGCHVETLLETCTAYEV